MASEQMSLYDIPPVQKDPGVKLRKSWEDGFQRWSNKKAQLKWHGTMAGFVWSKRKEKSHLFDFGELFRAYDKYEVIGNIHDNPELLEVE